jgi:hypothetical protein
MWLINDLEAGIAERQDLSGRGSVDVDFEALVEDTAIAVVDRDVIERVVASSSRKRAPRKRGAKDESKWEAYAALVKAAGLGTMKPEPLRVEYAKWRKRHFG